MLRLVCWPHAGGAGDAYRHWSKDLPLDIEVVPVVLPGRGPRIAERPFGELIEAVHAMSVSLVPILTEGPFALFGHSMGALMAFEFERMLERVYGISAVMLFVSGACAPQTRDPEKAPISSLPDQEFIQELRKMNGTPQDLLEDPAAMECLLPIIRADCRLVEGYRFEAGSAVRCPVVALGGISDTEVSIERVRAWGDLAGGRFSYSMFEGDHFFINSARGMVLRRICMALGPMLTAVS